jgi:hypothetical protein
MLGGRSTHLPRRGRYGGDLGRISGFPVRAGHAHHPQRSIPFMSIFPRGVHSPHEITIGLQRLPVKRPRSPNDIFTTQQDAPTDPGLLLVAVAGRWPHHNYSSAHFLES